MICAAYGENAVSYFMRKRYQKFRQGNFSLELRAGTFQQIEMDELQLLDINSAQTEKLAKQ